MIDILLNEQFINACLVFMFFATPVSALFVMKYARTARQRRIVYTIGALGPIATIIWGFHALLIATLGFDSVFTALILLVVCAAAGWFIGGWIATGSAFRKSSH